MLHRIREAMTDKTSAKLGSNGPGEIDETFVGGKVSLATWLGPLRRLFWPTPWDVDVEGARFCWSVARRA